MTIPHQGTDGALRTRAEQEARWCDEHDHIEGSYALSGTAKVIRRLLTLVETLEAEKANHATKLVDEERRRWYRSLHQAGFCDFEGLAPEIVAAHLWKTVRELEAENQRLKDAHGNSETASTATKDGQSEGGPVAEVGASAVSPGDCYNCGGLQNTALRLCARCSQIFMFTAEGRMISRSSLSASPTER